MKIATFCSALTLLMLTTNLATAVVIVDEDFESYATDAEFHANWAGVAGTPSPGTPEEVEQQFELGILGGDNADFNGDNVVNIADYTVWRDNLGASGASQSQGDANNDGNVNAADYDSWKANFGGAPPITGQGNVVEHLINYSNQDPGAGPVRVPDGVVEYQQVLNPNNTEDGSVLPTEAEPVIAGVDILLDESEAPAFLQRNTLGLRNVFGSTTFDIVELGLYNDDSRGFAMRAVLWQGSSPNWQYFDFDPSFDTDEDGTVEQFEILNQFGPAWHRWEAEIGPTSITATVDLLRDGMNNATGEPGVDATLSFDQETNPGFALNFGFNNLRFGGPSGLYTTENAYFDNIFLSGPQDAIPGAGALAANRVPEPETMTLVGVALGACCVMRRRCG